MVFTSMNVHSKTGRAVTGRQSIHPKTYAAPAIAVPKQTKAERKTEHQQKMKHKRLRRHGWWMRSEPRVAGAVNKYNPKRHADVLRLSRLHPNHPDFRGIC